VKNFAPIASVSEAMVLVVHPSFPGEIGQFVTYAKANHEAQLRHAEAGNVTHLTGEMFRSLGDRFPRRAPRRCRDPSPRWANRSISFAGGPVVLLPLISDGERALGVTVPNANPARCSDHGGSRAARRRC
jgi:hypothetical protein